MKEKLTAEETLNSYFAIEDDTTIIEAMKAYALQEVKRHLQIAKQAIEGNHSVSERISTTITEIKIELT